MSAKCDLRSGLINLDKYDKGRGLVNFRYWINDWAFILTAYAELCCKVSRL